MAAIDEAATPREVYRMAVVSDGTKVAVDAEGIQKYMLFVESRIDRFSARLHEAITPEQNIAIHIEELDLWGKLLMVRFSGVLRPCLQL